MNGREAKDVLYEQFARVGKVVAHPGRIELLELLTQGERSVEALAAATGMGVTNTSAQLQVLRQARLVESRKEGTRVLYRAASEDVPRFLVALRDIARARLAEVNDVVRDYFGARDDLEPVSRDGLLERVLRNEVALIDVRPAEEYEQGHIPGASSVPLADLDRHMRTLSNRTEVVAYCRGPYCVLAPEAVERLRARGFEARRLEDGVPEWRLAGLPVVAGEEAP